jgi:Outer membrane lipoprotein-sorting protein
LNNFCAICGKVLGAFGLVFLLGFFPRPGAADTPKEFADRIQKTYEAAADLSLSFTQSTYVAVLEKDVSKRGSAQFKKPGKSRIDYEGEAGRQYISDGKTLWVMQKGESKAQALKLEEQDIPIEALNFLGGLGKLQKDFAVEEVEEKKWAALRRDRGKLRWLELTPLKRSSSINSLVMGFDPSSTLAQEIYIFTDSGNLSHYSLKDIRLNGGVDDSVFEFKK